MVSFYGGTAYSGENVKHTGPYVLKETALNTRVYIGNFPTIFQKIKNRHN